MCKPNCKCVTKCPTCKCKSEEDKQTNETIQWGRKPTPIESNTFKSGYDD